MTTSPTTSAGPSLRVDPPPAPPPPRPGLKSLPGIVLAGLPTLMFSVLMAGALALPFVGTFLPPPRVSEVVLFTVIPGLGLLVFARNWWRSLREFGDGAPSWAFLFVPFFIVVGGAMGVSAARAILTSGDPGMAVVRDACRPPASADILAAQEETARCEGIGRACMAELIASGRETRDALDSCVRQRMTTTPPLPTDGSSAP